MDNKDSFEDILRNKMEGFEKVPPVKLDTQLKNRLEKMGQGNFQLKKILLWTVGGLLLAFISFQYLQNKNPEIPIKPQEQIQYAQEHFHEDLQHGHHKHSDEVNNKDKILVAQTPDDIKNKPYIQARLQAKAEEKLIFIHAFNLDCSHCQKMKEITLVNQEVQEFLQEHFVKIDIDLQLTANAEVIQFYDIKTSPTFLFLNGNGQIVAISHGFQEPAKFITILEKTMEEAAAGSYIDLISKKYSFT